MRFQIQQKDFHRAFSVAAKNALDEKSHLPILSTVRIDAEQNGDIRFEAHSVNATIYLKAKGEVIVPGSIAAPRMLVDRIHHMPEGLLDVSTEPSASITLAHTTEKRRFFVHGLPTTDWPTTLKPPEGTEQQVPAAVLRLLIDGVDKAISTDETVGWKNNIMLLWREARSGAYILASAIDGHRLMTMRREVPITGSYDLLVRKGSLRVIKALLDMAAAAELPDVGVTPSGDKLALTVGNATYVCRLTDEKFPPYEQAIPGAWVRRFKVPRVKLLDAVKGSMLVNQVSMVLQLKESGGISVSSNEASSGDSEDTVDPSEVICDPGVKPPFRVKLMPRYLKETLESMEEEDVFFCPTDFGGVVMVVPSHELVGRPIEASHLAVIMPQRE